MAHTQSQRLAYGNTLVELAKENNNIVVLEADLSKSTMGSIFEAEFPERFFEMGIAEANMASAAAGLALEGFIPFMATFAVFATGRCYDQIRTGICIPKLNVKICGSSAGLSDYGDGSTHQSVDDIALMRVLPNMQVFSPADSVQLTQIIKYMAEHHGPMYIRVNRNELPIYTDEAASFDPKRAYLLKEGSDAAIFATGSMVHRAIEASRLLEAEGISARVINVPTLKPMYAEELKPLAHGVKALVSAEEHSRIGGLGAALAELFKDMPHPPLDILALDDVFGTSALNYEELLVHYGLTAANLRTIIKHRLAQ
ncbi:MAG: 1-deoxy-D-xylulose-5-phosphate synthase [Firmicutes bacterium ADurb.Bin356]|nr:MAG: 1-deoxy-D-xylulose-5-phosphate synthase [Firmicutes bacterium ADurb.Bin356]